MNLKWLPLVCVFLSACSDKQRSSSQNKYLGKKIKSSRFAGIDFIHQQEAKHSDIPIPLNAFPIPKYFNQDDKKVVMGYTIPLSLNEVTLFYTLEMERLGWQQIAHFDSTETLLSFEKPGNICAISIRPSNKKSRNNKGVELLIFTGLKEISYS